MTNNFPGLGYVERGRDFNFFQKVSVSATTFGGGSVDGYQPDILIKFPTQSIILLNEASSGTIEYSFNGFTVHGQLDGSNTLPTKMLKFDNRVVSLIWFRTTGATQIVSVQAW